MNLESTISPAEHKKLEEICVRIETEKSIGLETLGYSVRASIRIDTNNEPLFCMMVYPLRKGMYPPTKEMKSRIRCFFADRIYYAASEGEGIIGRDVKVAYRSSKPIPYKGDQLQNQI